MAIPRYTGFQLPTQLQTRVSLPLAALAPSSGLCTNSSLYYVVADNRIPSGLETTVPRHASTSPLVLTRQAWGPSTPGGAARGDVGATTDGLEALELVQDITYMRNSSGFLGDSSLRVWWFNTPDPGAPNSQVLAVSNVAHMNQVGHVVRAC